MSLPNDALPALHSREADVPQRMPSGTIKVRPLVYLHVEVSAPDRVFVEILRQVLEAAEGRKGEGKDSKEEREGREEERKRERVRGRKRRRRGRLI